MIEMVTSSSVEFSAIDLNVSYSPALLLDGRFDASIIDHADFAAACRDGFEDCLETFEDWQGWFVSWFEMQGRIVAEVTCKYDRSEEYWGVCSLPWRVGFMLGVLSAYARIDRVLALCGCKLLTLLAVSCQQEEPEWFKEIEGRVCKLAV